MAVKYEKCPICNKKGLHRTRGSFSLRNECRYCKSSWAIAKWTVITQEGKKCPKCNMEGMEIRGKWNVYPHYCNLPQEEIDKNIESKRQRYIRRLT